LRLKLRGKWDVSGGKEGEREREKEREREREMSFTFNISMNDILSM